MAVKAELQKRLVQIEADIRETERRLPAHSVKPPIMMALIALEDERDDILRQLADLSGDAGNDPA
jgi:hypothetical protein